MEAKKSLRVLFCMGINQNFFDAEPAEAKAVWAAFGEMWNGIHDLPGVHVFGNLMMTKAWLAQVQVGLGQLICLLMFQILKPYMPLVTYLDDRGG